ncbi:signal transduction histidine kinase [Ectothiorhodospira sp. PHS-1]|nr:signal transduction histidine kinase [Ectothiorhodospira sp. PHS-1]
MAFRNAQPWAGSSIMSQEQPHACGRSAECAKGDAAFRELLEHLPQRIFIKDTAHRYVYCNQWFANDIELQPEDIIGKNDHDLFPGHLADQYVRNDQQVLSTGKQQQWEERFFNAAAGAYLWAQTTKIPWRDAEGRITGVIGVFDDITERKAAEDALRLAKEEAQSANKAKSLFMAMTSHEVRTPLTAMLGLIESLLETPLTNKQYRQVEALHRSCEMLRGIVNDILDFSESEAGQRLSLNPEPTNVRKLLEQSVELMEGIARARRNRIVSWIDPALPEHVLVDSLRLRQVLWNIIGNANKYTEHGTISIGLRCLPHAGSGPAAPDLYRSQFDISDTGIGIDPEIQARLFEPFYKDHSSLMKQVGGAGLGLAIVRNLVTAMGGEVTLRSQREQGTTVSFQLDLPRADPCGQSPRSDGNPAVRPVLAETSALISPDRHHLLVVDDNEEIRELVKETLESLGCDVTTAGNGEQAVALALENTYDLILMDCQMPVMSGLEATRHIRSGQPEAQHTPIVALTAAVMKEDVRNLALAGMDDHLSKPYTRNELKRLLERWLGGGVPRRSIRNGL